MRAAAGRTVQGEGQMSDQIYSGKGSPHSLTFGSPQAGSRVPEMVFRSLQTPLMLLCPDWFSIFRVQLCSFPDPPLQLLLHILQLIFISWLFAWEEPLFQEQSGFVGGKTPYSPDGYSILHTEVDVVCLKSVGLSMSYTLYNVQNIWGTGFESGLGCFQELTYSVHICGNSKTLS